MLTLTEREAFNMIAAKVVTYKYNWIRNTNVSNPFCTSLLFVFITVTHLHTHTQTHTDSILLVGLSPVI